MQTDLLTPDASGIDRAVAILRQGGLVAIPTETVYGLAGDARSDAVVAAIYAAKGRPGFNPLIVHLPDLAAAERIARFDDRARALAQAFWPGPLTLVLPLHPGAGLSALVTAGLSTVAVRVPAHPDTRAVIAAFAGPIAAPSANPSGRISPTTAAHVLAGLGGQIDAVLDGGACSVGIESTIVGLNGDARLLRPGGIDAEAIERVLGHELLAAESRITAPGQMASHYAPRAAVRLNVERPLPGDVWIGFGADCAGAVLNLSPTGNLDEATLHLFQMLHQADAMAGQGGTIAVAPVPDKGLGQAINDRLRRAAAPR